MMTSDKTWWDLSWKDWSSNCRTFINKKSIAGLNWLRFLIQIVVVSLSWCDKATHWAINHWMMNAIFQSPFFLLRWVQKLAIPKGLRPWQILGLERVRCVHSQGICHVMALGFWLWLWVVVRRDRKIVQIHPALGSLNQEHECPCQLWRGFANRNDGKGLSQCPLRVQAQTGHRFRIDIWPSPWEITCRCCDSFLSEWPVMPATGLIWKDSSKSYLIQMLFESEILWSGEPIGVYHIWMVFGQTGSEGRRFSRVISCVGRNSCQKFCQSDRNLG